MTESIILDKYSRPIFSESYIFQEMYKDNFTLNQNITVFDSLNISMFESFIGKCFNRADNLDIPLEEFDVLQQQEWYIPNEYKNLDIFQYLKSKCSSHEEISRLESEFVLFEQRGLINLLRWVKYFVDICTENDVFWGVGRGSSTSSFVLYLIGLHLINPIKYDLDYLDFMR